MPKAPTACISEERQCALRPSPRRSHGQRKGGRYGRQSCAPAETGAAERNARHANAHAQAGWTPATLGKSSETRLAHRCHRSRSAAQWSKAPPDWNITKRERRSRAPLLRHWTRVPLDERTRIPDHLFSQAVEDEASLPQFVKEWLLQDIKSGGTRQAAFNHAASGWSAVTYDVPMQRATDRLVSKGVAPGHGGIHQEL